MWPCTGLAQNHRQFLRWPGEEGTLLRSRGDREEAVGTAQNPMGLRKHLHSLRQRRTTERELVSLASTDPSCSCPMLRCSGRERRWKATERTGTKGLLPKGQGLQMGMTFRDRKTN